MKIIACNLNMFDAKHGIYVFDDQTGNSEYIGFSDLEHLPEIINAYCQEKEIYEVHLFGGKEFAKEAAKDIIAFSKMHYGIDREINVEVN